MAPSGVIRASSRHLSPNEDGRLDSVAVTGTFDEPVAWKFSVARTRTLLGGSVSEEPIYESFGTDPQQLSAVWLGLTIGGVAEEGSYVWTVTSTDDAGNEMTPVTGAVNLDRTAPIVRDLSVTQRFDPSERGAKVGFSLTEAGRVAVAIVRNGRRIRALGVTLDLSSGGDVGIRWDGRNAAGRAVEEGRYRVQIRAFDRARNLTVNRAGVIEVVLRD